MPISAAQTDNIQNILNPKDASQSAKAKATLAGTLDDFLLLLTTQLNNQDPLSPMESAEFTQQIAALSSVEQQINTNKNLEQMLSLFTGAQTGTMVNYIGKRVDAAGNKGVLQNGAASFVYNLDRAADSVKITITNEAGRTVYTGDGLKDTGRNEVFWNGTNSATGRQEPDGVYTVQIEALDANGAEVKSTTLTTGRVTAVESKDGKPTLLLGTIPLTLEQILQIREDPIDTLRTQV